MSDKNEFKQNKTNKTETKQKHAGYTLEADILTEVKLNHKALDFM